MGIFYGDANVFNAGKPNQNSSVVIVTPSGEILKEWIGNYSVTYTELYAIRKCCYLAQIGDEIVTDNSNCVRSINKRIIVTEKNFHTLSLLGEIKVLKRKKNLKIYWVSREKNKAGWVIEEELHFKN